MDQIAATLSGLSTLIGMSFFGGIVWWAWSDKRIPLNEEAARIPFDLPDECKESEKEPS